MQQTLDDIATTVADVLAGLLESQDEAPALDRGALEGASLHDLGVDSLTLVQFTQCVEDTFQIRIEDDDLTQEAFTSFDSVCALVARYLDAGKAGSRQAESLPPAAGRRPDVSGPAVTAQWAEAGLEAELLVCTARVGMTREHVERALSLLSSTEPRLDWGLFMDLATRHRVLGLVAHNFDREGLGPIGTVRRSILRAVYLYNRGRAQAWERERRQLFTAFDKDGVRPVVRKGSYLSPHVYPDPAMRYMEDTDLYVAGDDVEQVAATLQRLGYQQGTDSADRRTVGPLPRTTALFWGFNVAALPPFLRPTSDPYIDVFSIDLRRDLMEPASGKSLPAEDFRSRAQRVRLAGDTAWVPSHEDMFLDLGIHLFREATTLSSIRSGKDLCLIRFVDMVQWYRHAESALDIDQLVRLAERYGVEAEFYYSLHFTDVLFPGVLDPGLLRRLRPDDLSYLDEYGALDGSPATWPVGFRARMFDRNRVRHVSEPSALPRPRRQW
ncbi:nucleotidyltransferase family protein [Streptomyces sp. SAI-127]|uniref:nucleotidyltransferase family protein n=1 Tax=Streptomyces sp. SAI-127 TaxID=2940543 RepID=UPI0024730AF8|nr:nucleotidyltransferase family protein [Streptomyces sp. SAI-127]MDH6492288.1 acyl carrier protein [Streptomyces sp. SAI-127]